MTQANWFLIVLHQDLETPLIRTQREDFEKVKKMKGKLFMSFIYLFIIKWSFIRKNILSRTLQKYQHLKHEKWV